MAKKQYIIVHWHNTDPIVYEVKTEGGKKPDKEQIIRYFMTKEELDQDRDSITFFDRIVKLEI